MTHRPFVFIAGFWALGIVLDYSLPLSFGPVCLSIVFFLILTALFSGRTRIATFCLWLAIAGAGIVYTQGRTYVGQDNIQHVAKYYRKKPIKVKGIIVSDVQKRDMDGRLKTDFTLKVDQVEAPWGWENREGRLLVNIFNAAEVSYGDRIVIEGKLHRPYNFSSDKNFSYRHYLERRDIHYILSVKKNAEILILNRNQGNYFKGLSLRLRNVLKDILSKHLSPNEAGIMQAILLGDRSAISKPIRALFVQTGTAHILAISGLHIGIAAALFLIFAKVFPIGRRGQLGIVIFLLIAYAFLTGGRPSVIRATILSVTFLASFIIEKEFDMVNTLCLAAFIILLLNPLNLFDIGFQLSFICVFSIVYLGFKINRRGRRAVTTPSLKDSSVSTNQWMPYIVHSFQISSAIWLGVAGLIAYYFAIITPITVIANLVVVPLISVVVALGFGLLLMGMLLPSWSFMVASCLKVVLNAMAGFIYLCDKVPFAYIYVKNVSIWHVAAYYVVLLSIVIIPWGRMVRQVRDSS